MDKHGTITELPATGSVSIELVDGSVDYFLTSDFARAPRIGDRVRLGAVRRGDATEYHPVRA